MNELMIIQEKIYEIRGQKVMLDRDLAELYGVETSQLKRAVKRNIKRFNRQVKNNLAKFEGEDFMIEVSQEEILRCQFGTSSWGGNRYSIFAFTELGVAMLSSVLHSETAIEINKQIMRAFVAIRRLTSLPFTVNRIEMIEKEIQQLKADFNDTLSDQNDINEDTRAQLDAISLALSELQTKEPPRPKRNPIGFK